MDVVNELLDAIEIIVDKKIRENTAQIYPGICKSINGNTCVMSVNGKNNTVQFYGSTPTVGSIYRVFVPDGNMSMAFAITGNDDRKGLHYSNPNLLDNWYFGNPVNQRGQTEYTGNAYCIDRWILPGCNCSLVDDGLLITTTTWGQIFRQLFPQEMQTALSGKTVTFSVLATIKSGEFYLTDTSGFSASHADVKMQTGVTSWTFPVASFTSVSGLGWWGGSSGAQILIHAAKLELGSQQTLAHQENGVWQLNEIPDYGEQLARCQRYFQLYSSADLRPAKAVDCRPVMRTDPSQGTIVIGSTTYYYNTADL